MVTLIISLSWITIAIFAVLALWSFVLRPVSNENLPKSFLIGHNIGHIIYCLSLLIGLIATFMPDFKDVRGIWEYLLLFAGAGVVYARGLMPKGWMWRILNEPPKVAAGLMLASLWIAAAILGFIARGKF